MDSDLENFINSLASGQDQRFGDEYLVFTSDSEEMFAMVHLGTRPLQIDIRCDRQLGRSLQNQYESIMPARKLDPRQWVTVLVTPQLEDGLVEDLLRQAVVQAEQVADT